MESMEGGDRKNPTEDVGGDVDFLNELEEDFGDVSDESSTNQTVSEEPPDSSHGLAEDVSQLGSNSDLRKLLDTVKQAIGNYKPFVISSADFSSIDPSKISRIYQLRSTILKLISCEAEATDSEELLSSLNDLTPLIRNDIDTLHKCMVILYSHRFQELSSLVTSAVQYAKVVQFLERANLNGELEEENYSYVSDKLEEDAQLTKEQTLVLMISLRTSLKKTEDTSLTEGKLELLFKMSDIIIELDSLATKVSKFVSSKVHLIAPNVCALVGAEITALLLSHTGGIAALSRIPTCNLASIGKRRHLSHELHNSMSIGGGTGQAGYIGRCELVQYQPAEYRKQMLRMLCAKVTLAARVDAGQHKLSQTKDKSTSDDTLLGEKWRKEIEAKITKLRAAPLLTTTKPLPVPEDKKRKRRAGRRYRRYKEQFQPSYLRQLQNRVEFGKPETTVMDSFGEEIGLGMASASLRRLTGSSGGIDDSRPVNNTAKMTKKMRRRLQEDERQEQEFIFSRKDTTGGMTSLK